MSLVLTVISYRRQPMAQPLSQRFDAPVVTIGRGPDNDWTLPDPDQIISKKHCAIRVQGGRYTITDTSTNGVFLNGSPQPVGNGQSEALADGDRLQLGEYEVLVKLEGGGAPAYAPAQPAPQRPPVIPSADDPFGLDSFDFAQPGAAGAPLPPTSAEPLPPAGFSSAFPPPADDPFGAPPAPSVSGFAAPPPGAPLIPEGPDWLLPPQPPSGELAPDQYAQQDHLPVERAQFKPPPVIPRSAIPDNWNPLSDAPGPAFPPIAPPPPVPPVAAERIPQRAPLAAPAAPSPALPPFDAGLFAPLPPAAPHPAASNTEEIAAPAPPQPPPAPVRPAQAPRAAAPTASAGQGGDLFAAFLEGAGIDPGTVADQAPAELMALAGRLLREMASGLREALAARAMIKAEYRVEQTLIRAADNNPLKFSVEPNQMLAALLSRAPPGYLAGAAAVAEGFKDLRVHELALFAGMQAAVAALLRQFDPEQLKQRLEQQSLLQNLLPAARKAKYWEIYEQHYKQIAADVSEDVRGTFGRAFANAYEEQARKL
jgi:type VI secretion system protein